MAFLSRINKKNIKESLLDEQSNSNNKHDQTFDLLVQNK
jgi:hypothetical protein